MKLLDLVDLSLQYRQIRTGLAAVTVLGGVLVKENNFWCWVHTMEGRGLVRAGGILAAGQN